MTRVEIRAASKAFGGVHALEDVQFELLGGEVVGLLGHNGAGKSTLVRALSGADPSHRVTATRSVGESKLVGMRFMVTSPGPVASCVPSGPSGG